MISVLQPYPDTSIANVGRQEDQDNTPEDAQERAFVKKWLDRITAAKAKWKADFERMRDNMEFTTGLQWRGQKTIDTDDYVNNITLRVVNQKVATLYAKNPTIDVVQRPRMEYSVWDEEIDSLREAAVQATLLQQGGAPLPPEISSLMDDYLQGQERKRLVKRVAKTLQYGLQYFMDAQKPEFKGQMKQAVRRAVICGVAFARPIFCKDNSEYIEISSIDVKDSIDARIHRIKELLFRIEEDGIDKDSAHFATLRSLVMSVGASQALQEEEHLSERIECDFPLANSVIVDPRCSNIKEFVGARWIAQEYILPIDELNAIFNTDINIDSSGTDQSAKEFVPQEKPLGGEKDSGERLGCAYEVWDKTTKTKFFVCDGYKKLLLPPEVPTPSVTGFWQHFTLTFNDIEVDPNSKTSIYPPSDVQICKSPQKEWNRTRNDLRDHRRASAPRYYTRQGMLSDEDLEKMVNCAPNDVIGLKNIPPDQQLSDVFAPIPVLPVDPKLYDTAPLEQDLLIGVGMQQANVGPAQPNVTATVGSIAEQSRMDVAASNVDDLDMFLSAISQAEGEMMLKGMSAETIRRIVGPGSAFPTDPQTRQDFLNEIYVQVQAASSGRPNKAIEVSNFRDLAPLILNAGGNPVGVVEEGVRRLGDNLEVSKFFPLVPPQLAQGGAKPPSTPGPSRPGEPTQPPAPNRPESTAPPLAGNGNQENPPPLK